MPYWLAFNLKQVTNYSFFEKIAKKVFMDEHEHSYNESIGNNTEIMRPEKGRFPIKLLLNSNSKCCVYILIFGDSRINVIRGA